MVPLITEGSCKLILVRGGLRGVYMVPLTTEGSCKLILVRGGLRAVVYGTVNHRG